MSYVSVRNAVPFCDCFFGDYLTTGLFVSGCYFAVICNNKLLNFVSFHKCTFSPIILKFSVKPYNKILEKLRCRGSVSYTTQCNGNMSEFQNSKPGLIFFHEPLPIFHSFKQVMKILRLFTHSRFFSSTLDLLNTKSKLNGCP